MALTADEQNLLDFALAALPPWFSDEDRDLAVEAGVAKMMGAARGQVGYWFTQALIGDATGPTATTPDWLQQHGIDRGTRRQNGEGDAPLRSRLRTYPDALTRATLLSVADDVLAAAGVAGDAAMIELRADRAYLVTNGAQLDATAGGEFIDHGDDVWGFLPALGWRDGQPPYRGPGIEPPVEYRIEFVGAAEGGNDGQFTITGMDGDECLFTNPTGGAGMDTGVFWRVDRYDRDGNSLTGRDDGTTGKADAYLDRGFRCGAAWSSIAMILPFGTSAAVALSVLEAVRQRKAAGVRVIVERRQTALAPPPSFPWVPSFTFWEVWRRATASPTVFATDLAVADLRRTTADAALYVDIATGADANPGTNPLLPLKSIWAAIAKGGSRTIYVKAGSYPTANRWAGSPVGACNFRGVADFTTLEPAQVTTTAAAGSVHGILSVNTQITIENFTFVGGLARAFLVQNGDVNAIDCAFQSSQGLAGFELSSNVAASEHDVLLWRCSATGNAADGFSATALGVGAKIRWVEIDCTSTGNGLAAGTHQGSTIHKAAGNGDVCVIRIGGTYADNWGPQNIADVGGVASLNLGVVVHGTTGGGGNTGFYCGDAGTMWLHGCAPTSTTDLETDNAAGTIYTYHTEYATTAGPGTVDSFNPYA